MQTCHAGLGQQNRRFATRNLGGGDNDVETGGLLVDGSLLLGLLFGAQRTSIATLTLTLGEIKTQIQELGTQGFDFTLGGRAHVVCGDDRTKTLGGADGLQAGDTGAKNEHLGRADRAGGSGHHRQERIVSVGCHNSGLITHHGVLGGHLIHGLSGAQLTRQLLHGNTDQAGLLNRSDITGIGERAKHTDNPSTLLDASEQRTARTIDKTKRVSTRNHFISGDDLRSGLNIILINIMRCDSRTGFNQAVNTRFAQPRYDIRCQSNARLVFGSLVENSEDHGGFSFFSHRCPFFLVKEIKMNRYSAPV